MILSSSGYLTKPIHIPRHVKVICYCHTPPRFLYGYPGMDYRKYWYAQVYKTVVGHFYDFMIGMEHKEWISLLLIHKKLLEE